MDPSSLFVVEKMEDAMSPTRDAKGFVCRLAANWRVLLGAAVDIVVCGVATDVVDRGSSRESDDGKACT